MCPHSHLDSVVKSILHYSWLWSDPLRARALSSNSRTARKEGGDTMSLQRLSGKSQWFPLELNLAFVWWVCLVSFLCVVHSLVFSQHPFVVGAKHCDPLHRVKITAVAQAKVEFCWHFYISPITCCLRQQSTWALQWSLLCSFKLISTLFLFPVNSLSSSYSHSVTKLILIFQEILLPIQFQNFDSNSRVCLLQFLWIPAIFATLLGMLSPPGRLPVPINFIHHEVKNLIHRNLINATYLYTGDYSISLS